MRPDTLVAIGRIAGGTVGDNHSLIWALEGSAGALLLVGRASGWRVCQGEQRQAMPADITLRHLILQCSKRRAPRAYRSVVHGPYQCW
ncbi:MAG: hypothetical protein EOQ39_32265 [Mesorhizobium sp.]|nr:MAG: hypothetical protein EOQ37_33430 [Mesorhizobium sp.]RWB10421.1 MAG: hypothetical protein EOQ39_32265 [Mesorhizobium sp.]RWP42379.1 MAG: hypothetical protein EOR05_29570 [Mesorhizobium sp.]